MDQAPKQSRRKFISAGIAVSAGLLIPTKSLLSAPSILKYYGKPSSYINGVQIGVITYSFRSMPDQSAEATLQYILDSGISAVELMGGPAESFAGMPKNLVDRRAYFGLRRKQRNGEEMTKEESKKMADLQAQSDSYAQEVIDWRKKVSMSKFKEMGKMYKDAGVSIYGFKPRAFTKNSADVEIDYGLRAAKALGASHVTLEHPSDDAHTLKLGTMAKKHRINVAYHGHLQQTPNLWDTALQQSKFNMLNPDLGHYVAAGNKQPLHLLKTHHKRISSMHLKDRQTLENGQANLKWGEGDTPIGDILNLMKTEKYKFPATVELEYAIPEDSDAVKEVQKCLEYCEKMLS